RTTLLLTLTPNERFLLSILRLWGLVGIHVIRKHMIQNDGNYEYNSHTVLSKYRLLDLSEKLLI
ncbi:hypothetical protein, partial [Coprococcus eutactus]|uniref:hypothetical protein n=1 Tax=Coprococcus eutactus TaxID=33043 RepID=UPI00210A0FF0